MKFFPAYPPLFISFFFLVSKKKMKFFSAYPLPPPFCTFPLSSFLNISLTISKTDGSQVDLSDGMPASTHFQRSQLFPGICLCIICVDLQQDFLDEIFTSSAITLDLIKDLDSFAFNFGCVEKSPLRYLPHLQLRWMVLLFRQQLLFAGCTTQL